MLSSRRVFDIQKYDPNAAKKEAPETRVNTSLWTFELTRLGNNLKFFFEYFFDPRPFTLDPRLGTLNQKAISSRAVQLLRLTQAVHRIS